VINTEVRIN